MKFVVAILAVVACASASILPLGPSLSISQPLLAAHGWAQSAWAPASAWASPISAWAPATKIISSSWAPSAHIAILAAPAEGQYVAANRGSVHVAPLPGHVQSASSLNLQPAPGTW